MKKLIFTFYLFLFTRTFVLASKDKKPLQKSNRKNFLMTTEQAQEKDNDQIMRIKDIYRQQYLNEMHKFNVQVELEKDNISNLEGIHLIYERLGKNVDMAKGFLLDRMDQIYENFIQPSRWYF